MELGILSPPQDVSSSMSYSFFFQFVLCACVWLCVCACVCFAHMHMHKLICLYMCICVCVRVYIHTYGGEHLMHHLTHIWRCASRASCGCKMNDIFYSVCVCMYLWEENNGYFYHEVQNAPHYLLKVHFSPNGLTVGTSKLICMF